MHRRVRKVEAIEVTLDRKFQIEGVGVLVLKKIALIWDIDGTLLNTSGVGVIPFEIAVTNETRLIAKLDRKRFSGFTDFQIAKTMLETIDYPLRTTEVLEKILITYTNSLKEALIKRPAKPIGEIPAVLRQLRDSKSFLSLIGTGNYKPGAHAKLESAGLKEFFTDENIFCTTSQSQLRTEILLMAKQSLPEKYSGIVIGDSPSDIQASSEVGLKIICTATGQHSREELMDYKPNLTLPDHWKYADLEKGIYKLENQ